MKKSIRMAWARLGLILLTELVFISLVLAQLHNGIHKRQKQDNVVAEMQVLCHSDAIVLKVNTNTPFNGMLYAKEAPNSQNCMSEFHSSTNMTFKLPLKSCGTSYTEVDDGIEYFNTVVVQPHMRLMTNQGKGYHIRCKYQTRERTIANTHFNVSAAFLMQNGPQASTTPLLATASMPSCTMKIFRSGRDDVAETVKIGDKLIMVIEIDQQDMYGMKITNCVVRDGLNLAEQQLISDQGCPLDDAIMPKFEYTNNYTRAAVSFPAHKFPHTSSVYYQCNVRLCINNGNCDQADCSAITTSGGPQQSSGSSLLGSATSSQPSISAAMVPRGGVGGPRRKRFVHSHGQQTKLIPSPTVSSSVADLMQAQRSELSVAVLPAPSELRQPRLRSQGEQGPWAKEQQLSFDVYSGLYVSDADAGETSPGSSEVTGVTQSPTSDLSSSSSASSPSRSLAPVSCLNWSRASLLVVLASCASVALVLLLACQAGFVGPLTGSDSRTTAHLSPAASAYHLPSNSSRQRELLRSGQQQHAYQEHLRRANPLRGLASMH